MDRNQLFSQNSDEEVRKIKDDLSEELFKFNKHSPNIASVSTRRRENGTQIIYVGIINDSNAIQECLEKYRKLGVEIKVEQSGPIIAHNR